MAEHSSRLKRWLLNGIVITIPLVVTLIVLLVVLDFVLGLLSPLVDGLAYLWPNEPPTIVVQLATLLSLVGLFLAIGFVAEYTPGTRISRRVDEAVAAIPGVGTVYTTVREASTLLVDDEAEQFQEVKLVEFPHREAYVIGFLTGDTPPAIEAGAGEEEMVTVMVPLGPNPTTNGFIMHMPAENVHDVDLTVEEAVQSIATLGVAVDAEREDA